jgi:hypothetical protein
MNRPLSRLLLAGCAAAAWFCSALPAQAIPVFARKYGFNCTMCHSAYPRLNDFGVRYRQNGYQLPGRESEERTVLQSPAPIAFRTSAGYNYDPAAGIRRFQINGLDLLSGGLLGYNLGYFMIYVPEISGSSGVAPQTGSLEMANVMFSNVASTSWLNLRVGRFEPAYVAFSVKRQLSVAPVEIYEYTAEDQILPFSETQEGIELTGYGRSGLSYAVGWINGSPGNSASDPTSDVYVRAAQVFGQGEGQTAGQRVGLIGYLGKARPSAQPTASAQPVKRLGADISLNYEQLNLAIQGMYGMDDKSLWGTPSDAEFWGGFTELSYLPLTELVGFLRYDHVTSPKEIDRNRQRVTVGGRYYFVDNLALHAEFSRLLEPKAGPSEETVSSNQATARLDFAF